MGAFNETQISLANNSSSTNTWPLIPSVFLTVSKQNNHNHPCTTPSLERHKKDCTILVDLSTQAISTPITATILKEISPITAPSFVTIRYLQHSNFLFDHIFVTMCHHEWPWCECLLCNHQLHLVSAFSIIFIASTHLLILISSKKPVASSAAVAAQTGHLWCRMHLVGMELLFHDWRN